MPVQTVYLPVGSELVVVAVAADEPAVASREATAPAAPDPAPALAIVAAPAPEPSPAAAPHPSSPAPVAGGSADPAPADGPPAAGPSASELWAAAVREALAGGAPAAAYGVQPGDTLASIAAACYGTDDPEGAAALWGANHAVIGSDPEALTPGMPLIVPARSIAAPEALA